jgi:thiamine kinase-like enzyme
MIELSYELKNKYQLKEYELRKLSSGNNAGAYLLECEKNKFILKSYGKLIDGEERFMRERSLLEHCAKSGINNVPKMIDYDFNSRQILLEYLGHSAETTMSLDVCKALFDFIKSLNKNSNENLSYAKDAYLENMNVFTDIQGRIKRLKQFNLPKVVYPFFEEVCAYFFNSCGELEGLNQFDSELFVKKEKIVSPSDVGLHNMLFINNKFYFIDFEYSGYDNPIKFFGDLIANPDNHVSDSLIPDMIKMFHEYLGLNLEVQMPEISKYFRIKWCLIIIEHWLKHISKPQQRKIDFEMERKLSLMIRGLP